LVGGFVVVWLAAPQIQTKTKGSLNFKLAGAKPKLSVGNCHKPSVINKLPLFTLTIETSVRCYGHVRFIDKFEANLFGATS
jgi:hypothetical protein